MKRMLDPKFSPPSIAQARIAGLGCVRRTLYSVLFGCVLVAATSAQTLQLHPDNPHYLSWRGKPVLLITSAEHYGAVLNADFDYRKYLDTLEREGMNLTRLFTGGAYVEPAGAFNIARNTLAPAPGRYITPWTQVGEGGAWPGGKFDLRQWNGAYFQRLRDCVSYASQRGVVVEVNLFCPFYEESQWKLSPFHAENNVNQLGNVARTNVYTLDQHGGLLAVQERMVRKFVDELREFDNVYYEICNEPYFGGVTLAWQHRIADVISAAQKEHPSPKLISQNIANKSARIQDPHSGISIFNFHYATPPEAVAMNYHLGKVLGDNETGFRGTNNTPYRTEAWEFMLAGGGLYNNLDYSFTVGHEDGTFVYPAKQPGGGNPQLRRELKVLRDFMQHLDFVRMAPDRTLVKAVSGNAVRAQVLSQPDRVYAVYLLATKGSPGDVALELDLPAGQFEAAWIDPLTGRSARSEKIQHQGGLHTLRAPAFVDDLALQIRRTP